ncbi:hypothetical protein FOMG_05014 [Fusarium oxysporum f. sp. melonis 26406]|uniref:Uncharacterized protein n=1 Tax=Fusarium oxysporum f. sp. melonis 26406 TaxID=1089452 RepID=X0AC71_FUSOX|nr:hypothetical protein FOMG_05014 [Fusarium oxysporum f. sp. melonis 26406]
MPNQNAAVKKLQAVLAIPNQPLPKNQVKKCQVSFGRKRSKIEKK